MTGRRPSASDREADSDHRVYGATALAPRGRFDHARIERGLREILCGLGLDPDTEGLRGTPARYARMCDEVFAGLLVEPRDVLDALFHEDYDEMVLVG